MGNIVVKSLERGGQGAVLNRVVRDDLIKKVTLLQRLEGNKGVN